MANQVRTMLAKSLKKPNLILFILVFNSASENSCGAHQQLRKLELSALKLLLKSFSLIYYLLVLFFHFLLKLRGFLSIDYEIF